jgi:hypothetical protein
VASEAEQSNDRRGISLRDNNSSLPVYLRLNTGGHAPYIHVKTLGDRLWNNWWLVRQYSRLAELDRVFYIDLAIARNNLASTLGDMKLWEEAKKEAGKALEVTQKIPAGAESYDSKFLRSTSQRFSGFLLEPSPAGRRRDISTPKNLIGFIGLQEWSRRPSRSLAPSTRPAYG